MGSSDSTLNSFDEITTTVATINLVRAKAYTEGVLHERRRALTALETMLEDLTDKKCKTQLLIVYSTIEQGDI